MIHFDKDPTLGTYFLQVGLQAGKYYSGELDNWRGPRTEDALEAAAADLRQKLPSAPSGGPGEYRLPDLHRNVSKEGIDLIKHFEGLFLSAYLCPAGVWTIGYGHTGLKHKDGTVYRGRTITEAQAEELFRYDMDKFEGRVVSLITVPLNEDEFSALVSFDFNTGGLGDSSLRRKLNAGDRKGAADEFLRWDKVAGRVVAGLTRRRKSERNLFLGVKPALVR